MSRFNILIKLVHRVFDPKLSACSKGNPIILMHGLLEDKDSWEPVPQLLAEATKRRVYTYDARNHGESELTLECNFKNNVYDLLHLMFKLDIKSSILVGKDMGGMTAIRAALMLPKKVETAFIMNMHTKDMSSEHVQHYISVMKDYIELIKPTTNFKKLNLYRHPPSPKEMEKQEFVRRSVLSFRIAAIVQAFKQYEESPASTLEGKYDNLVHFLYDEQSKYFTKENMEDMKKSINEHFPQAAYKEFYNGVLADPDAFVNYIASQIPPTE